MHPSRPRRAAAIAASDKAAKQSQASKKASNTGKGKPALKRAASTAEPVVDESPSPTTTNTALRGKRSRTRLEAPEEASPSILSHPPNSAVPRPPSPRRTRANNPIHPLDKFNMRKRFMTDIRAAKLAREAAEEVERQRKRDLEAAALRERELKVAAGQQAIQQLFARHAMATEAEELDMLWRPEFADRTAQDNMTATDKVAEADGELDERASIGAPTHGPPAKVDKADADKARRKREKEKRDALKKTARDAVDATGLQEVVINEPTALGDDDMPLTPVGDTMDVDVDQVDGRDERASHCDGAARAAEPDATPKPKKLSRKKHNGPTASQEPADKTALLDDWRQSVADIAVSQATLDAEATAARSSSTKKGKKKKAAVREEGLGDADVETSKRDVTAAKKLKSTVALADSAEVPEAKPRPRRTHAIPPEKSRSAEACLPPVLLNDNLFNGRIVPALIEEVGSRFGEEIWDVQEGLADILNELCSRYVPNNDWNIRSDPSDKIYTFAKTKVEYWRVAALKSIKRMVNAVMIRLPDDNTRKEVVRRAISPGGEAFYAHPDETLANARGLFQSSYMLKGLAMHLDSVEGSERRRDRPLGALCLTYVQVLSAFDSWRTGVDRDTTKTWTELKVKGLLKKAWTENIERYTRHPKEFDVILAAAHLYRQEHGKKHKARATTSHGVQQFITRLAPPSSDIDPSDGSRSSSSDEDSSE
ncbi:unnamed protein product [Peniophora sp. CBMAI 1063]|nr:unnamed protein product [Peniophora sp. CBMAI 1063]